MTQQSEFKARLFEIIDWNKYIATYTKNKEPTPNPHKQLGATINIGPTTTDPPS